MSSEQAGFRANKSRADHINTLNNCRTVSRVSLTPTIGFIDFQQAFDTLAHNAIWQALKENDVHKKVTIEKAIYDQSTCNVLHKNQVSEPIPMLNGVTGLRSLTPAV
jgi:hypothetical protein